MRGARPGAAVAVVVAVIVMGVASAVEPPFPKDRASRIVSRIHAAASKVNLTPFTLTDELAACRADPICAYYSILQLSDPAASNPDGLPGGLFDDIGEEMAPATAAADFIGPTGVWGEAYTDTNGNGRQDSDESFTDDPANSSLVPGAGYPGPLGDPVSSTNKFDGAFLAGYGNDRKALGAFDEVTARVLYIRDVRTGTSIAWVTVDFTGYFSDFVGRIRARLPMGLDVDHILLTHTHNHEAPDVHVGLWGEAIQVDGTYPRFEIYVEAKIAQAIADAVGRARPAQFRFGSIRPGTGFTTPSGYPEDLSGMQSRNSCRTPWFFDDELRAMQVIADSGSSRVEGPTIGTLINWGAHVESMDARNVYISADFPHAARSLVESELGGVALYAPSAQGAVEIIGDSCTSRWHRSTFDGETFAVDAGGDPLVFGDPYDNAAVRDRSRAIGRVVGSAALAALDGRPLEPQLAAFEFLGPRLLCFPVNNAGLAALAAAGVIDKPLANPDCPSRASRPPDRAKTDLYAFRIGRASFVTAPGELAPELLYGVDTYNRFTPFGGDYVTPNSAAFDCAARSHHKPGDAGGNSDRPLEPAIRPSQIDRFATDFNFLIGYTPDLLGYIVPGYDFFWLATPTGGFGLPIDRAADPCSSLWPDNAYPNARYGSHYHETNSAGSMLAPAVTCEVLRLLGDPLTQTGRPACMEWDTTNLTGRPPTETPPVGYEPGCDIPPSEGCLVRHY